MLVPGVIVGIGQTGLAFLDIKEKNPQRHSSERGILEEINL